MRFVPFRCEDCDRYMYLDADEGVLSCEVDIICPYCSLDRPNYEGDISTLVETRIDLGPSDSIEGVTDK